MKAFKYTEGNTSSLTRVLISHGARTVWCCGVGVYGTQLHMVNTLGTRVVIQRTGAVVRRKAAPILRLVRAPAVVGTGVGCTRHGTHFNLLLRTYFFLPNDTATPHSLLTACVSECDITGCYYVHCKTLICTSTSRGGKSSDMWELCWENKVKKVSVFQWHAPVKSVGYTRLSKCRAVLKVKRRQVWMCKFISHTHRHAR